MYSIVNGQLAPLLYKWMNEWLIDWLINCSQCCNEDKIFRMLHLVVVFARMVYNGGGDEGRWYLQYNVNVMSIYNAL